jgi:hypothetical protein
VPTIRRLRKPPPPIDVPPRSSERVDAIAILAELRAVRQLAAVAGADDDPRDAILGVAGVAGRAPPMDDLLLVAGGRS